jgi:hypothetical protein
MKELKSAREPREREKDFYKAFVRLGREPRRQIALRILRDQKMLKDLYDHFLIQRSLAEPGDSVAWERFQG